MSDLISRKKAINVFEILADKMTDEGQTVMAQAISVLRDLPSAEPETITIEEVSNQLGCATIQSALYWFEFLKTLDLLGFAIVRKKTR